MVLLKFDYANGAGFQFEAARVILEDPKIGFNVGIDGMSLVMVLLTSRRHLGGGADAAG